MLLAIPTLSRRRQIVEATEELGFPVLEVPSVEEITRGRVRIDALRPVYVEELLGRDELPPDPALLGPEIRGLTVWVSGAGGSIGSELSRRILRLQPQQLVLLEH